MIVYIDCDYRCHASNHDGEYREFNVPGTAGTEKLFSKVDDTHAGTWMIRSLMKPTWKYMRACTTHQNDVIYLCIRSSGQPLYHDLSALVGNYVEVA